MHPPLRYQSATPIGWFSASSQISDVFAGYFISTEYHMGLGVQDVALLVQEVASGDPHAPPASQYDDFDEASDDMDAVGGDDVAAIMAEDINQPPGETSPLSVAPINAGNRVHHSMCGSVLSTSQMHRALPLSGRHNITSAFLRGTTSSHS